MMFNAFKKRMEFNGLDYKKEILKIVLTNVILVILIAMVLILTKIKMLFLIGIVILFGANYMFYYMYTNQTTTVIKNQSDEFVHVIAYFRIFIANKNNVYQSFNRLMNYSSEWMRNKIEIFLRAIDDDKSIKPFIDFANCFNYPIARNVMICIYQMVEQGENEKQLNQFSLLFEQMNRTLNDERKERKTKSFDIVSFLPIVGVGLVTLSLTFAMLSVVGEIVNVI